jgi:hypothetical protein
LRIQDRATGGISGDGEGVEGGSRDAGGIAEDRGWSREIVRTGGQGGREGGGEDDFDDVGGDLIDEVAVAAEDAHYGSKHVRGSGTDGDGLVPEDLKADRACQEAREEGKGTWDAR